MSVLTFDPRKYDNFISSRATKLSTRSERNVAVVTEPFTYISSRPGKDIRGKLIQAWNLWTQIPQEQAAVINNVIGILHTSSLLLDDIEDDSELRRGVPVAHKVYGVPQTINSANHGYFAAYDELNKLRTMCPEASAQLSRILTEELILSHRGQGIEILWRDSLQCPTEDEYVDMVNGKTGGLLRIMVRMMMSCATENKDVDYVPLSNLIGVFFQIRDDYCNLKSGEYTDTKGFAEDLTEGKFSFPIVHGIRANTYNHEILDILRQRPTSPTLKRQAINYLDQKTSSFKYTMGILRSLEAQARAEIQRLGGNAGLERVMDVLSVQHLKL